MRSQFITTDPITGVIAKLEGITRWATETSSRVGFFSSLYLRVTSAIRAKLGTGYFEDDDRMAHLDAVFAARYLDAFQRFRSGESLPDAWDVALKSTTRDDLIVIQHILVGMNAHINIDLAIAAVETCPGHLLDDLKGDFMKITTLLESIVPTVVSEIGRLSPLIGMLSLLDEEGEIQVLNFSMSVARTAAWNWAVQLNSLDSDKRALEIDRMNVLIAALGNEILKPGFLLQAAVDVVRMPESKNVPAIINVLNNGNPVVMLRGCQD